MRGSSLRGCSPSTSPRSHAEIAHTLTLTCSLTPADSYLASYSPDEEESDEEDEVEVGE